MLQRLARFLEAAILWLSYEAPRVAKAKLTPGLREKSQIISRSSAGSQTGEAGVAVVALFPDPGVTSDLVELCRVLTAARYRVLLVANRPIAASDAERLRPYHDTFYLRRNVGRDFGGYKDVILSLFEEKADLKRLILLNDSCHYIKQNLATFVEALSQDDDLIGATENFDPPYHLGSFALSFSGRVFASAAFQSFWKDYLPVSTRRWSIVRGEMGLSYALLKAGFAPKVIYNADLLANALEQAGWGDLNDGLFLLPRGELSRQAQKLAVQASRKDNPELRTLARRQIIDIMTRIASSGSQVHSGGLLYIKFLASPLVKKDVVFRGVLAPDIMYSASRRLGLDDEVVATIRRKQAAPPGGIYARRLRGRGLI